MITHEFMKLIILLLFCSWTGLQWSHCLFLHAASKDISWKVEIVRWLKSSPSSVRRYDSVAPCDWTGTFLPKLRELPSLSGKSALPSPWHWARFNGHCVSRWLAPGGQGVALHGHSWLTNVSGGTMETEQYPSLGACLLPSVLSRPGWMKIGWGVWRWGG